MKSLDLKPLTNRQQQILDYIIECVTDNGAPPTRVEIAEHFGFRSPNAAEDHLKALDKKGHIELRSGTSRGIVLNQGLKLSAFGIRDTPELGDGKGIAVIGDVAAGAPIFATQHIQQHVNVDQSLFSDRADFLLKVRGDSMVEIGIFEHDLLAIKKTDRAKNGEIVVARIDDDVTVKRYQKKGATVLLIAENEDYDPIEVNLQTQSFVIEGVVVGLIRQGL